MSEIDMNQDVILTEKTELLSRRKRAWKLMKTGKFWRNVLGKVFMYTMLTDFALVFLIPVAYMIISGIESPIDFDDRGVTWIPRRPVYQENIDMGVKALDFYNTLWYTVKIVGLCTLGHVISGALVGYAVGRLKFMGRGLIFGCVLMTLVIPAQAFTTVMFQIYTTDFEFLGGLFTLSFRSWPAIYRIVIPCFLGCGLNGGLFIFIFRQVYAGLPKELEEAAMIDGCGIVGTFRKIMLPLTSSAILVSVILSVVWHWNDLYEPTTFMLVVNTDEPVIMSMRMYRVYIEQHTQYIDMLTEGNTDKKTLLASQQQRLFATFLSLLPILIGYMFIQKNFMASVASTGIKG